MVRYAVEAQDLHVTIGKKNLLHGVNLRVEKGSFHGIIGPNGAGKTTLFDTLVGFREATSGTVRLLGEDPWPRKPSLLARIGIQPQHPAFFVRMTLKEHLDSVARIFGAEPSYVNVLIDSLHLDDCVNTRVENLSGGERQRLAVASALVHKPEVLFLDEPTSGLDPSARKSLVELLHNSQLLNLTTLYTTHYLDEAERLCDVISVIDSGEITYTDTPQHFISQANLGSRILLPAALPQADIVQKLFDSVVVTNEGVEISTHDTAQVFVKLNAAGVDTSGAWVNNGRLEDAFLAMTERGQ
ncbi:ABC transporter ATP-binding protein [Boudabousia marimammalium]|uniref:ABC transporter n=1 Tax=Boudabousia marimammalium TaxID=156892 RepID=A0A1Q5PJX0_9ACTO|nr:ABC transporter ATP-binding protein [Boudabousia marimammalium]OKL46242.1 ABC transporter [Boudabousia marimammalium]